MAAHNPEEVYHAAPRGRENRASLNHPGWPLTRGTDDDGASPSREGRDHPWGWKVLSEAREVPSITWPATPRGTGEN